MFWSCVLKGEKPKKIKVRSNKVLHISTACLKSDSGNEKVYLKLQKGEEEFNMCLLQKGKIETYKLNQFLILNSLDNFKLQAVGSSNIEVHVTGTVEKEEEEKGESEDGDIDNNESIPAKEEEKRKDKTKLDMKEKHIIKEINNYDSEEIMDDQGEDIFELLKNSKKSSDKPTMLKSIKEGNTNKNKPKKKNKNKNNKSK